MYQRSRWVWLGALALVLMASPQSWAGFVTYTVEVVAGSDDGLFQYNLSVNNLAQFNFGEPISGLNIFNGNSVFGLDGTSVIGAPQDVGGNPAADWAFFAPVPPLVDELNYFSLAPAGDVPLGGSLGGFSFQSTMNPDTLSGNDFLVEVVLASGVQPPPEVAQGVPEPSTWLLLSTGTLGLLGYGWRRRKRTA